MRYSRSCLTHIRQVDVQVKVDPGQQEALFKVIRGDNQVEFQGVSQAQHAIPHLSLLTTNVHQIPCHSLVNLGEFEEADRLTTYCVSGKDYMQYFSNVLWLGRLRQNRNNSITENTYIDLLILLIYLYCKM